jgi:glycosyltransferase involved in cell wall biosynthesis
LIKQCPVSVVILTYNEGANIGPCLESVSGLSQDVFLVDSFSTDNTIEIARRYTDNIYQNPWVDWATQRNWALDNLPLSHEWVFFLDADERVTPEFAQELGQCLTEAASQVVGLYVHFRFFFMGRPLRFAYESPPVLRLVRRGRGRWQGEGAREYASLDGEAWTIKSKLDHWDLKGLVPWLTKQTQNAVREVELHFQSAGKASFPAISGQTQERPFRRWLRYRVWERLPRFWRTFPYFFYRFILRGGILDGKAGLAYCFLHALWYPLLIDMMIEENNK